jgi:uncharacterized protein
MANKVDLDGRWVVVTGASSGLGREMALGLARDHRAHVLAVARRADRLEELRETIGKEHDRQCVPIVADLATPARVE